MHYSSFVLISVLLCTACSESATENQAGEPSSVVNQQSASKAAGHDIGKPKAISIPEASRSYITVAEIRPQSFAATVQAPSRVEFRAKALSTAGAVVSGRVGKINVQVGDTVKAGTPLAVLESSEAAQMRSDVSRTRAELQRSQDRAKRQENMLKSGVGLEIERSEANFQLEEDKADYERSLQAARLLGEGTDQTVVLRAPIEGVVLRVDTSIGTAVQAGTVLFELGEPGALWIVADIFENDLPLIEKGAKVELHITTLPKPVAGHVAALSAAMQADLRRGAVYIDLDDHNLPIKPGMYAKSMIEAAGPKRIVLPTTAVLIKDKKQFVVYVETQDGLFEPRNVTIGQAHDGFVPVLEGLVGGERVVVSGALLLDSEASMLL
ncbi:cobalt-zinc-cadmium efflux system membrane fusion protein [Methylobacter tundripaludum]|uniref:Cobalt-zinc-cadmium efflux system membrane fusion protein n=1 Tax=Methylobacter tundripaludum TaxID=173365 RepID=A0A2S6H5U9_9GAMM|nr:efflux RND transporter periplasmic adaptor subunit [Methylobacter tundripaludum]PPK72803.1 cobalt-zinc-cadmium efflux system membrane fusion protein [Methylobacter tundripaludum]